MRIEMNHVNRRAPFAVMAWLTGAGATTMMKATMLGTALLALLLQTASAQYQGWKHSGSLYILTTPEGANLPAAASEEDFPLLVRLNRGNFDFTQASARGEDIRFSADGKPLAYQIEEWEAAAGQASIWVRIPLIRGNARQEIKMHWGQPDAASESKGSAVFNESNGYVVVMHMGDPVDPAKDDVGTLKPKNVGATVCRAIVGNGLHFDGKSGVECGENPTAFPTGAHPHSTEAWIRPLGGNHRIIMWGYGIQPRGPIQLFYSHPPFHFWTDCWGSQASVNGESTISMGQWYHVVHTYKKGEGRLYVNGVLDGATTGGNPMNIVKPQAMWIAVEYGRYFLGCFKGDMDEVRISKVTRSADWVKMEYENQKPLQTMVGPLVQTGNAFSVSPASIEVDEGQSATVTAHASGAQKLYWLVKKDGLESIAAVDQYSYTLDAGRVVGDTSYSLRLKAIYANEVKTKDIPVTVKDTIPEPVFTLKAPSSWNGRDTIEVVPEIRNLAAMTARGAGELHYRWTVSGGAVIKEVVPGKLVLKRSQYTGPITVKAAIDNGGPATVATTPIQVTEPKSEPWVQRIPEKDEKPEDGQFYARDDHNEGTLYYNGTLDQAADAVFLKLYADGKLIKTETQEPAADKAYAFTVKLKPGLIKYKVEFGTKSGGAEKLVQTVTNLVCGDAYLIDGQSNALALDTGEQSPNVTSEWIRSYGGPGGRGDETNWVRDRFAHGKRENLWCSPFWRGPGKAALGWWGMELAKRLLASQKMPICIIQAAEGGTRIDEHIPNEADHADLKTMYGHMLWRVKNARLTHGIRAVLWHQGEADQGSDGPDNGYDSVFYQQYFLDMSAAWKADMPNIRHYYIFQIWPNGCSQGGGHGDMLREKQRTLPRLYSNMDVMSTLGIRPGGGCHYPLTGWSEFARLMQPLIERDFYGKAPAASITAPNLKRAYYTSSANIAIALEFDQPVVWKDELAGQFYLDGVADKGIFGAAAGNVVTLKLPQTSAAKTITYLKEMNWSQEKLLMGANGIAALTFCNVPIEAPSSKLITATSVGDDEPKAPIPKPGLSMLFGLSLLFCTAAKGAESSQWNVFETSYTSAKAYTNAFVDVEVDVVFQQGERQWKVPAFWAGGDTWKARFAPPAQGMYTCRVECTDKTNSDLNGKEQTLSVAAYTGDNPLLKHGFLRVSTDNRHFAHADGTPFFWLGDTWWKGLCKRLTWKGFQELTADRKAKGFSVVQIVCGVYPDEGSFEPRWENEGGKPYLTRDFTVVNPAYFEYADRRIKHLVEAGIVPAIVGGWGRPDCDGMRAAGVAGIKRHWRNLIARYGAYPTVWIVGGESAGPRWTEVARYVRKIDPYRHPSTIHPGDSARNSVTDETVIDFDMLQTGHGGWDAARGAIPKLKAACARTPAMPVVIGEYCYEGHMQTAFQDVQRYVFWGNMLNGSAGHTYGAAGIWHMGVEGDPGITPIYDWTTWKEGMNAPGSTQLGLNKKLLGQYPWWRFEPHPEWAEGCFAAGIPGEVRFVYLPRRGIYDWSGFVVRRLERDVAYHAFYFNPTNGKRYDLGTVISAGPAAKPFEGHAQPLLFEDRFEGTGASAWKDYGTPTERKDGRLTGGKGMVAVWEKVSDANLMASAEANSNAEAGIILRFHDADNYVVGLYSPSMKALFIHDRKNGQWGASLGEMPVPEIGPKIHLIAAVCGTAAAIVLTDGKKTYYTPIVEVTNTTAGKTGLWLYQIGDRQEFRRFELSRAQFVRMKRQAEPSAKHDAQMVLLHSDEWRTPNVPSPQDWVLVLERVKP